MSATSLCLSSFGASWIHLQLCLSTYLCKSKSAFAAGPEKKYPPLTGFDLLSKTGNAYEARKNDPEKKWQKKAYSVSYSFTSFKATAETEQ